MKELSLSHAFRFMLVGAIAFEYFFFCLPEEAGSLLKALGAGAFILILATGSVVYMVYRPLIYDTVFVRLQDLTRRKSDNYRTFLKREYSISPYQAIRMWAEIKDKHFSHHSEQLKTLGSSIHYLYMSGIMAIPFAVWQATQGSLRRTAIFIAISLLTTTAAVLNDRYCEDRETDLLKSLNRNTINAVARRYGGKPRK